MAGIGAAGGDLAGLDRGGDQKDLQPTAVEVFQVAGTATDDSCLAQQRNAPGLPVMRRH